MFTILKHIMKSFVSYYRDTYASIFTAALFMLGNWVNLDAYQVNNGEDKIMPHINHERLLTNKNCNHVWNW